MKKGASYFLILNLFLSIIAFSFILNIGVVDAAVVGEACSGTNYDVASGLTCKLGSWAETDSTAGESTASSGGAVSGLSAGALVTQVGEKGGTPSSSPTPVKFSESILGFGEAEKIDGKFPKGTSVLAQGSYTDAIVSSAAWAGIVAGAVQFIAPMAGANSDQTNALTVALAGGVFTGQAVNSLWGQGGVWSSGEGLSAGWSAGIGLAVAAVILYMMWKDEETETKTFECDSWQAPTGGANCEKCNKQGELPCSEYQCKSLGQACQLLNPGTEDEKCTWVNRKDVNPPVIKPLTSALLNGYVYAPDATISPPDKGVKVRNNALASKCAAAFTPLTFGVTTNEPAQCKISPLREKNFEEMSLYFGGSTSFTYNHTQVMVLPGAEALNASGITIDNDGNFEVFTRCQDANGNANTANFVFKYCVEQGPDTTPPLIVTTSLLNDMPIAYNQNSVAIDVFTNEPATCKWDPVDTNYDSMNNNMTCSSSVLQMNTQMLYKCSTTLTGLKNEADNDFYFRCKDTADNMNAQSHKFTLIGTRPLVIDSVSPNNTVVSDATDVIQVDLNVLTSAGYKDGESACYYSTTGAADSYVMFFNTNTHNHTQELWLAAGDYDYYIKCLDLGGNTDLETISFTVESDVVSPLVVRVYHEGTYLKLVTNEDAECVYDATSCSYTFEDGIKVNTANGINHYTDWDTQTNFYVKCKDQYGNKPLPNKCNIIAKPSQI